MKKELLNVRTVAFVALCAALAWVLMLYNFPLPLMPPFMKFDFAGVIEIFGAMMLGPIPGILIVLVKDLLKLLSTDTFGIGELSNFIVSLAYILPPSLIYYRKKTKKRAIIGMAIGIVTCTVVACLSNMYMIIPFYAKAYGMDMDGIVAMCQKVNSAVKDPVTFVALGVVPFNVIKTLATSIIVLFLYKPLSRPLKKLLIHE